jgi:two-component system LytT family response regulator
MRVMLVDDERLPMMQLKAMLEDIGGIHVIGTYLDPVQAIAMAHELQPEVVFLDIHMPEIDGLMTALQIQKSVPSVEIVFVTAYDKFAFQAFDLHALDYIMKPLQHERVTKTIHRLQTRKNSNYKDELKAYPTAICCMQNIHIQLPGKKQTAMKWRTAKAQELFAFLLHNRGQLVNRDVLLELLWPNFEASRGSTQLYTTIYHIRQTLNSCQATGVSITSEKLIEGYRLEIGTLKIDTEEWERQLNYLGVPDHHNVYHHEQLLDMYKGDYLGEYNYLWAEPERERLRRMWVSHAQNLSQFYIMNKKLYAAVKVNELIQKLYPLFEECYFMLMKLYDALSNREAVVEQYNLLTRTLDQELECSPNDRITSWYTFWERKIKVLS